MNGFIFQMRQILISSTVVIQANIPHHWNRCDRVTIFLLHVKFFQTLVKLKKNTFKISSDHLWNKKAPFILDLNGTIVEFSFILFSPNKGCYSASLHIATPTSEGVIKKQCNFPKWWDWGWDCLMGKLGAVGVGDATALSLSATSMPNNL